MGHNISDTLRRLTYTLTLSDQDAVEGLFDRARQSGAEEGTAADLHPQAPQQRSSAFQVSLTRN